MLLRIGLGFTLHRRERLGPGVREEVKDMDQVPVGASVLDLDVLRIPLRTAKHRVCTTPAPYCIQHIRCPSCTQIYVPCGIDLAFNTLASLDLFCIVLLFPVLFFFCKVHSLVKVIRDLLFSRVPSVQYLPRKQALASQFSQRRGKTSVYQALTVSTPPETLPKNLQKPMPDCVYVVIEIKRWWIR